MTECTSGTRLSVLVVDDDDRLRRALARLLRGHGFTVGTSTDATAALHQLETSKYDAVVSDQSMAGTSGLELLVRVSQRWPNIARVLLAGQQDPVLVAEMLGSKTLHGLVAKPPEAPELFATLDRALRRVGFPPMAASTPVLSTQTSVPVVNPACVNIATPGPTNTATRRFLVVGDAIFAREVVATTTRLNAATLIAEDHRHALQWLRATPVDLCLIDADTLGASLNDTVETIKREVPDSDIVVATSADMSTLAISALRVGAADIIRRPLVSLELVNVLNRSVERQRRQFAATVHSMATTIFSAERDALPHLVVEAAARIMQADDASLLLPDGEGLLYLAHSTNGEALQTRGRSIRMDACIAGRVASERRPVVLLGTLEHEARFANLPRSGHTASSIVYPLTRADTLIGVLTLNRGPQRPTFVERDIERAEILALQISLALDNLQLVRTVASAARLGAVGELAAGLVHEISNPLSCVIANLELGQLELESLTTAVGATAALGASCQTIGQLLTDTSRGAQRIKELVRDVRLISRSDENWTSVFELGDAVRSAMRIARAHIHDICEVQLDLAPELLVHGNPGQISQVVLHLLANAEEAMTCCSREQRQLTIRSWKDGALAVVEVADTGPGISANCLSRIFESFVTTKVAQGHLGLGLPMSREIITRHGGNLRASSVPGQGAVFAITLPLAATDGPPEQESFEPAPEI